MNRKKFGFIHFISAVLFALLLTGCGSESTGSSEEQQFKFRITSGIPSLHPWHIGMFEPWVEQIEAESEGAISFDVFVGGELVPFGNEYDALRGGTVDMAFTIAGLYDPQRFPYTEVVQLPLLESNSTIASTAMYNLMNSDEVLKDGKTYYEIEFADKGIVAFPNPLTDPYVFGTKDVEFNRVEDFTRDIRLRSSSRITEILIDNLNATAITMPATDAYDSLSRNALDGLFYEIPGWNVFGYDELLTYAIDGIYFGHGTTHTGMTEETWNRIPEEYQEMIKKATDENIFAAAEYQQSLEEEAREIFIGNGGRFVHFNDLDPGVQEHFNHAFVQTWFDWIENLENEGHAGKKMAILWRDAILDAGGKVPQEIIDIE
ncbi:TRAP transporter substrate-binding protein DctP [Bacillus sp. B15-48]|uniref:TRAP transporter substrate-binding protein DctP n=1 Tax=Bacillus sp. B15-48 TaxID=1548601 RepID=UPI00193F6B49|nr:TRAP transporter substrate-binding protein DctP [Bacillus sp. B15-48]MBM4761433.1 hypothetical protein [Bacillus sp. B15-48]